MSRRTVFKQPARWNYLLDDSFPRTWKKRWRSYRPVLPLLVPTAVLLTEMILLPAWIDGRLDARTVWFALLFPPLFIYLIVFGFSELAFWTAYRTQRKLTLSKRSLNFSHSKFGTHWNNVIECRFEPVSGQRDLTRFSLTWWFNRKNDVRRTWSMILTSAREASRLRSDLMERIQCGASFVVRDGQSPQMDISRPTPKLNGLWLYGLAYFLFMHGAPLLIVWLPSDDPPEDQTKVLPPWEELSKSKKWVIRFMVEHFDSAESLRACIGLIGAALTCLSMLLFALALRIPSGSTPTDRPQIAGDVEGAQR